MANNIKLNIQRMPKPTTLTISILKLKLCKIQIVNVIENPKLENKDVAENIAKAGEEAHGSSCYFGLKDSFFFKFFCK